MIYIGDSLEDGVRLRSYSAKSKSSGSELTIVLEIKDPLKLGFYLKDLQSLEQVQKRKPLALPAPERFSK